MNGWIDSAIVDVVLLAGLGVILFLVLRGLRWLLLVLPASRTRLEANERSWPVIATVAVLAYLLVAAHLLLRRNASLSAFAGALVLFAFLALSWTVLKDVVNGVFLRASRVCRVGDSVKVDDVEGRVERLGWRAMIVVTPAGHEAIIPYGRVAKGAVLRSPEQEHVAPHVFTVALAEGRALGGAKEIAQRVALLHHWASIVREPQVTLRDVGTVEVTVFALDGDHAYEIEAAVRQALRL